MRISDHILPILWGSGGNGKTLMVETILSTLGDEYFIHDDQQHALVGERSG